MTSSTSRWFFRQEHMAQGVGGILFAVAIAIVPVSTAEATKGTEPAYAITIDSTALVPQGWWHVPGVTPLIWTSDPETTDAYRTTEPRVLQLKPGEYKFVSFSFDFPFAITEDGMVAYAPSLNQCVEGRGTRTLTVRCKRTYPYGGQPEYSYNP